jgi:hypothetical protein
MTQFGGTKPLLSLHEPNPSKQNQARPNKSKQKRLDLLGFIRPNRAFSIGYDDSKSKNPTLSQAMRQMSQPHFCSLSPRRRAPSKMQVRSGESEHI